MTIEIRELVVRATVGNSCKDDKNNKKEGEEGNQHELVATCVKQVLRVLERSKER